MTRDEIIRMAREADATVFLAPYYIGALERFAELVAKKEREACAKLCDEVGMFHEVAAGADLAWETATAIRKRGEE